MYESIHLIITKKIFGQQLTMQEQEMLDAWLDADPGNRKIYFQLKLAFSKEDQATLDRYRDELWSQINTPVSKPRSKPFAPYFRRWAAAFILISGLGWWIYHYQSPPKPQVNPISMIEKVSLPGQKIVTVLSDGTRVKLNSGSKLILPDRFDHDKREIQLIGEAFFEVNRDESRPFIIKVDNFEVKVLGTSFNVSAYPENKSKHVAVKTGKVSVSGTANHIVELIPTQMVQINESGEVLGISSYDEEQVFGWIDQKLVFKDNTLTEVISEIERWYDINITIEDNIDTNEMFTGTFQNPTLPEVLLSVTKAYKLDFRSINNEIIIVQ